MSDFEVLCVTMHQNDFSKIEEMNISSDVVFANQSDRVEYSEHSFSDYSARMITTNTKGVGKNRNIALLYAKADICLFADDDIRYNDNYKEIVLNAFSQHKDADIIIFNIHSDTPDRKITQIKKNHRMRRFERNPFGGPRIAVRLSNISKKNLWFTTLFGGGALFPSGEDSMFILNALKAGCKIHLRTEVLGTVSFDNTSWFSGYDEKFFFGKGSFYSACHPKSKLIWMLYFALKIKNTELTFSQKMRWLKHGLKAYREMLSFNEYKSKYNL